MTRVIPGIGANICVADEIRNFILSRTFGTEPEERISLTKKNTHY